MIDELNNKELLTIKSDIVFHYLFNNENMNAIEWLVMQILHCNYIDVHNKVTVENIRISPLAINNTQKYLDLLVHYKNDILLIELNNYFDGNYTRNVIYTMNSIVNSYIREMDKIVGESNKKNTNIYKTKKVRGILVNLNWIYGDNKIEHTPKVWEMKLGYPIMGEEENDFMLKIINVNLYKYRNLWYDEIKEDEKVWKLFTIHCFDELKYYQKDKMLTRYFDNLVNISSNEEVRKMVWRKELDDYFWETTHYESAEKRGLEDGMKKGLEQGLEQNKKAMIKNMFKNNLSINTIAKCAEISVDEVKSILNLQKN